jgi:hypothetical protein
MGIGGIGSRTAGSFGVTKTNQAAITKPDKQLSAGEFNRLADAVIEIQEAIGTTALPGAGTHERRVVDLEDRVSAPLTSQLASRPGLRDGEFVHTAGFAAAGDGGGSRWRFALGVSAGANNVDKRNASNGQWQLIWDGCVFLADWAGVPRDGIADALAGLHACLAIGGKTFTLKLGPSSYRTTGKLTVPKGKTIEGTCGGDGGIHTSWSVGEDNSTLIVYDGPTLRAITDCAILMNTGSVLRDVNVVPAVGKHIAALVGCNVDGSNTMSFVNVGLDCYRGSWGAGAAGRGTADFGYVLGAGVANQCDFIRWTRGFVRSPRRAAIAIAGAQPFTLVVDHTRFNNFLGFDLPGAALKPHGSIFEMVAPGGFTDICINNGENEYFACVFRGFGTTSISCSVNHMASEGLKQLWHQPGFAGLNGTCSFRGGRYDTIAAGKPVYDIDSVTDEVTLWLADTDHRFLVDLAGTAFTFVECNIGQGGSANDLAADAYADINLHNTFAGIGCTFPNTNPVNRGSRNGGGTFPAGGVTLHSCRGYSAASTTTPIAERHGPINPDGYFVVSDAETFKDVVFDVPELGQNGLGPAGAPRYLVFATPVDSVGAPSADAYRVRIDNIDTVGFRGIPEAAPTAGKSVTFAYHLALNPQGLP